MNRTQIYKEILREYDITRTRAASERRERIQKIYEQIPEIATIDEKLSLCGIRAMKLSLQEPEHAEEYMEKMKEYNLELQSKKKALLLQFGYDEHILEERYICSKCQDTGYVGTKICTCFQQKLMDKLYDQSNVRDIIKIQNFDSFDIRLFSEKKDDVEGISPRENAQKILSAGMQFVDDFKAGKAPNLLLQGPTGLGKTFVCSCIAKELLQYGYVVLYLTAGQLFRKLEEIRFAKNEEQSEYEEWDTELLELDLLIIDDLGTEFSTLFTSSELFRLLNDRKLRKKSTVISTNLKMKEIMEQYSDRITSRLYEYQTLKFFGEDVRVLKKIPNSKN